jgi:hypothetical protein
MQNFELRIIWHRLELANKNSLFGAVKFAELTVHGWIMHATIAQSDSHLSPN